MFGTLLKLWRRRRLERDLADELEFHRQMAARHGGSIPFGNATRIQEQARDLWRFVAVEDFFRDLRHGARELLRRRPLHTFVAVVSLALGLGASGAIFAYLDGLYLRPLDVPDADRLVRVFMQTESGPADYLSYPEVEALRSVEAFSAVMAGQYRGARYLQDGRNDGVSIYCVNGGFFHQLGVPAALGRVFGPEDRQEPVVVLGHSAWLKYFGGDPSVVGRTIRLSRGSPQNVTVLGVLPPTFRDVHTAGDRDLWMPPETFVALSGGTWSDFQDRRMTIFVTLARLRPGATLRQAQQQAQVAGDELAREFPATNARRRFVVQPDWEFRLGNAGTTGVVLFSVVLLVVTIACVNVANLLLGTVEARRAELAIRAAIGATEGRLARQLLTESLLLGLLASLAGLAVAGALIRFIPVLMNLPESRTLDLFRFDARVTGFTVGLASATVVLFGVAPAWIGRRSSLTQQIRGTPVGGRRRFPLRDGLAVAQVAVSLALLAAAALLLLSFERTRTGDIGLARNQILNVWQSSASPPQASGLERLRALPGVRDVAIAFRAPLSPSGGGWSIPVQLAGHPEFGPGHPPVTIKNNLVDSRYFSILGIRLLRGRVFHDTDQAQAAPVAVISEAMARRYWPAADPVGKYLLGPRGTPYQIVGVVADAPINTVGESPEPYLYTCWWQHSQREFTLLIQTESTPEALAPLVQSVLRQMDPGAERAQFSTMANLIADRSSRYRQAAQLSGALGLVGLLLTGAGLYGVISYGVTLRTREIGIRMALGADSAQTARAVSLRALQLTGAGVALGLPLALGAEHALRSWLFGVSGGPALATAALLLLAVAAAASWLPAYRASRIDPVRVMRQE
jgi:predicted permease